MTQIQIPKNKCSNSRSLFIQSSTTTTVPSVGVYRPKYERSLSPSWNQPLYQYTKSIKILTT